MRGGPAKPARVTSALRIRGRKACVAAPPEGKMGYVLVKFTETRGGTELGFPLDRDATDISGADFDEGTGSVHVEGHLVLNDDPVRCIADIDLATLKGAGRLKLEEKAVAAAE